MSLVNGERHLAQKMSAFLITEESVLSDVTCPGEMPVNLISLS